MRILVTGANGQIGFALKQKLSGEKRLLALTRDTLDITDETAVNKVVGSFNPDIIINAAAYTAVDKAESEEQLAYQINCDGPKFLAKAANAIDAAIIHISTDYVYDGNKIEAYVETDTVNPQGIYGKSKLAGEVEVVKYCNKHIVLRTAWVFGKHGDNFVKTMLGLGQKRDSLAIVGDQFGGPTYADDIADAIIKIAKKLKENKNISWGTYHFSGYPYVSWYEFAQQIFSQALKNEVIKNMPKLASIDTNAYPTPAARPKNSRVNCDKIKTQFDIEPSNWINSLKDINAYNI